MPKILSNFLFFMVFLSDQCEASLKKSLAKYHGFLITSTTMSTHKHQYYLKVCYPRYARMSPVGIVYLRLNTLCEETVVVYGSICSYDTDALNRINFREAIRGHHNSLFSSKCIQNWSLIIYYICVSTLFLDRVRTLD